MKVEVPHNLELILQNIAKSAGKVGVPIPRPESFLNKKGDLLGGDPTAKKWFFPRSRGFHYDERDELVETDLKDGNCTTYSGQRLVL